MFSCFKCVKNKKNINLDNVYVLDYSHQSLQDVPAEIFDYERTLTELNLGSNRIIDLPPQLFMCHELKTLCLNNNDIVTIPSAIGSLTNLTYLDFYRNNLGTTSIPDNIKQLKQLRYLNLSVNLIEKLPDSVTCLINLEELYLNDTAIEYLQANFGRLVNLKILELRDNRLLTLTKSMSRLMNLQRLDLGHNKLQQFPLVICSFENLLELILDENMLEYLPDFISNLKKLIYFDCSENDLIKIPKELKNLVKLQDINLSFNQLQEIPSDFACLVNLVTLKLNNNQLTSIPDSLFNDMKMLEELTLNDNFLSVIPSSIGRLRKLKFLTLDSNYIEYLPQEIGSCVSLSILSVRCNNLIEIPPDIGHLSNLKVLNIVNNNIRNLPISILNLAKLSALWISDNQSQPMVQLQKDHDGDFNYFLTCYMFPQCKVNRTTEFASSSDDDLLTSRNQLEKQDEMVHVEPKRRICFSGETTIPNDRPGRLLRSPTPYPKDLRTMAKSLSENQNKSLNSTSSLSYRQNQTLASPTSSNDDLLFNQPNPLQLSTQEPIQIKEAKIANKNTITSQKNDIPNETTSLLPPAIIHPNNYSIQNALEITKNMYIVPPNIDEFDSASSYCHSQMDLAINSKNPTNDYDDMLSVNSSVSQNMIMMTTKRRIYDNFIYDNQVSRLPFDQQQPLPVPPLPQLHHQQLPLPPVPPPPVQIPMQHLQPNHYGINQGPRLPPPYHIAKTYSKISPQDLCIYETVRNRNQNGNIYENTKDLQDSMVRMHVSNPIINQNGYSLMTNGNNMETIGEESIESSTLDENLNDEVEKLTDVVDGANRICYINADENGNCGSPSSSTMSSLSIESQKSKTTSTPPPTPPPLPIIMTDTTPSKMSPSKPWLFGLHKNPTVIQLMIRRNFLSTGFNIIEVPNMGIYINEIETNCDAYEKLHRMDKILDIDGFDFTKNITINEATDILLNSGNIINIMISRK